MKLTLTLFTKDKRALTHKNVQVAGPGNWDTVLTAIKKYSEVENVTIEESTGFCVTIVEL